MVLNKYKDPIPPDAVNIMRPSKWGNKFSHLNNTLAEFKVKNRDEAVDKYEEWIMTQPELIKEAKQELRGRPLLCCCHPLRCHGDVLHKIANN